MNIYIILASLALIAMISLIAFNIFDFTGLFVESVQNISETSKIVSPIERIRQQAECPSSCDDNNACTSDWCNETSDYLCSHSLINGTSEGCWGSPTICSTTTCISGKCTEVSIKNCCGNNICESSENCNSCSIDCGECPPVIISDSMQQQTSTQSQSQIESQSAIPNQPANTEALATQLNHIIISEVQTGPNEFVELYNPTLSDVDMTGWYFSYYPYNYDWSNPYRNKQLPDGSIIKKSGYFLIGLNGSNNFDWQPYTSAQLSNTKGSVAIFPFDPKNKTTEEAKNGRIDAVGWGEVQFVYEGSPAQTPPLYQSLEKKSLTIDTDNNSEDFMINTNPSLENSTNQ